MKDTLISVVREIGQKLKDDDTISNEDKNKQVTMLVDTIRFLQNYEENVRVLDKYWTEKKWKSKFEKYR